MQSKYQQKNIENGQKMTQNCYAKVIMNQFLFTTNYIILRLFQNVTFSDCKVPTSRPELTDFLALQKPLKYIYL